MLKSILVVYVTFDVLLNFDGEVNANVDVKYE